MINARAETLAEKPAFRSALRRRRCLIPADGFYEWLKESDGTKMPLHIRLKSREPFAFAGLWDTWHDPAGGGSEARFTGRAVRSIGPRRAGIRFFTRVGLSRGRFSW